MTLGDCEMLCSYAVQCCNVVWHDTLRSATICAIETQRETAKPEKCINKQRRYYVKYMSADQT